jgi:branched-subunit amino acid transport protein AzlD
MLFTTYDYALFGMYPYNCLLLVIRELIFSFEPHSKNKNFMKKLFPVVAIALVGILFTSCKKDYTCKCTYSISGVSTTAGSFTIHDTKSNAQSKCTSSNSNYAALGAGIQCNIQ